MSKDVSSNRAAKVVIPGGHLAPAGCSSWAPVGQAVPL